MHVDYDLRADGTLLQTDPPPPPPPPKQHSSNYGGFRPGAGRKPDGYVKPEVARDFDKSKARKESALADLNELSYKVKSGQYVARAAVQEASATLLAELGQSLRSLSDNLERKFNMAPDIAEEVGKVIDEALANVAAGMEIFAGDVAE